jgi:uncharacterized protein (TIGR02466 family)
VSVRRLFPTLVYGAPLQPRGTAAFNRQLLAECRQLREDDTAGQRWSASNYPGGYTSYGSAHQLHKMSPTFAELQQHLKRHVAAFARSVQWDLKGRALEMTDCWVNMMSTQAAHGLHLHPLSTVSGTYYVQVPSDAAGLKFEDPRLDRFMASPPRRGAAGRSAAWVTLPAKAGQVILFESWLRHEVTSTPSRQERISVSFNFNWF